jgi:uncharacterized protein YaiL (DUF2058 family)
MGTSFKDQLLKSGIANKKQARKAKHEKLADKKKNRGQKPSPTINKTQQEQLARENRNREKNQQLNQEKLKREKLVQARQLIQTNRIKLEDYDEQYYFAVGKKIKKLFVSEEIAKKLSLGLLAIVKLDDSFEIVPATVAEKIADRDQDALVVLHKPEEE